MISYHALSAFLLHHPLNGTGNENLRSVQEAMRASQPATEKYKNICEDFPYLGILMKSSTPDEVQLKFGHSNVGNKSLKRIYSGFRPRWQPRLTFCHLVQPQDCLCA